MYSLCRNSHHARFVAGFLLLCAGQLAAQTPEVASLSSTSGVPGTSLTISGSGFNPTVGSNTVYIGGVRATVTGATATSLTVTVPTGAAYGRVSVVNTASGLVDLSPQMFLPTFAPALGRALEASDFVTSVTTPASGVYAMEPLDLDADGKLDIVLTTATSDNILYRLNTSTSGSITFGAEQTIAVPGFAGMEDIEAGDLDGDGQMDIVATSLASEKFVVLRRTGSLTFAQTTVDTGVEPLSVALADVDNDGKLDVVVAHNAAADGVHVYRNTTVGSTISFAAAATFTGTISAGTSMAVADFNADGKDDILIARNSPREARVMENASSGPGDVAFTTGPAIDLETDSFPTSVTSADFDGDGKIDAVASFGAPAATTAGILVNTSTANVGFSRNLTTLASLGAHQNTAAVGDLTGDGKPDLVLPTAADADPTPGFMYRTAIYTNTSTSGAVGFAPKLELGTAAVPTFATASFIADLDGDDLPDVLLNHRNVGRIAFYRNAPVLAPTTQATNVSVSSTTLLPTQATISWTRGSGQRVVVFMKQTSSTSEVPVPDDLETYDVSSTFMSGEQIGSSGWYAVAAGTGTSITVSGLTSNTDYRVMVVEYSNNGVAGAERYQTATATDNPLNFTTPVPVGVTSLERASANPSAAATVNYTLTLDDDVYAGMSAARFSLSTTGVSGASIGTVTGSGNTWTIPVDTGTGSGTITLNFATDTGIVPGVTGLPFTGETYTIDRAALPLSSVTIASDNADTRIAHAGDTVTLAFTAAERITPTVSIAGHAVAATNTSGFDWTAAYTLTGADTLGLVSFSIAFVDALGNAGTSVTATTDASEVDLRVQPAPEPADVLVGGSQTNVDLVGPVYILANAVIDGGKLSGDIYNSGLITGTITLGPNTTIHGGSMSGTINGTPGSPAILLGVTILPDTVLTHVIIGAGTVLPRDAVIGAGVRFESRNLIPPGLDLTGALNPVRWSGGSALTLVDLGSDVLRVSTRTILEALQLMAGEQGNELGASAGGELTFNAQNARGMLLPVRVRQAERGATPGTYVDGDANIVFVTAEGYEIVMYPVLLADAFFSDVLGATGLDFDYDARGRIIVEPAHGRFRYVGRAAAAAVPAPEGSTPGLYIRDPDYLLVFHDEDGVLMEQELVPVPADWPNLRTALAALPGVSDVTIDIDGTLAVEIDGRRVRGHMAHQVSDSLVNFVQGEAYLGWAGDLNGDGAGDYHVFYPRESLVQILYVKP